MFVLKKNISLKGKASASQEILAFCKEIYSVNTKTSEHWLFTENLIAIEKNLLNGKWNMARMNIQKIASISINQALLQ